MRDGRTAGLALRRERVDRARPPALRRRFRLQHRGAAARDGGRLASGHPAHARRDGVGTRASCGGGGAASAERPAAAPDHFAALRQSRSPGSRVPDAGFDPRGFQPAAMRRRGGFRRCSGAPEPHRGRHAARRPRRAWRLDAAARAGARGAAGAVRRAARGGTLGRAPARRVLARRRRARRRRGAPRPRGRTAGLGLRSGGTQPLRLPDGPRATRRRAGMVRHPPGGRGRREPAAAADRRLVAGDRRSPCGGRAPRRPGA